MNIGETLTGLGFLLTGAAAAYTAYRTNRAVKEVKKDVQAVKDEVTPNNGLTNGETGDAILTKLIQAEDRQTAEPRSERDAEHMEAMADADPELAEREADRT